MVCVPVMTAAAAGRHGWFDQLVAGVIAANAALVVAGLVVGGHETTFEVAHTTILVFFVCELTFRLRGAGWRAGRWLRRPWNAFDTAVILLSFLPVLGVGVTLLRVARLARVVHLTRHVAHLRLARLYAEGSWGARAASIGPTSGAAHRWAASIAALGRTDS
jgi:hypothetical protein